MTAPLSPQPKRLQVTLTVSSEEEAEKLHAAWYV